MPYLAPVRRPVVRRLRGMRGLGDDSILSPAQGYALTTTPPAPIPPPPPPGWQTGYPTVAEIPPAAFPAAPGVVPIPSAPSPSASSGSALQVGTVLTYTAQISLGTFQSITNTTVRELVAKIGQALSQNWGIDVVGTKFPALMFDLPGMTQSFTLVVQLGRAYGQAADVKANIDHETIGVVTLLSSQISVGNSGAGASSWLADNWPWLAIGGAGLLFASRIL